MFIISLFLLGCSGNKAFPNTGKLNKNYEIGLSAYEKHNYEIAFSLLKPIAHEGNGVAQYKIADMYYYGNGISRDRDKALFWYKKAYKSNIEEACMFKLGVCIDNNGATPESLNALGNAYYYGRGGPSKNWREAASWYKKAAHKGQANAQYRIAQFYYHGRTGWTWRTNAGLSQNKQLAAMWYKKAAEQGNSNAQYSLGSIYVDGIGVEIDKKKAFYWWNKSANQNNSGSQYNLGIAYSAGIGVEPDLKKSLYWYKTAESNGNNLAKSQIRIVTKTLEIVKKAKLGEKKEQYILGSIYYYGKWRTPINRIEAFAWFLKSAEQNYAPAQIKVSDIYYHGTVGDVNYQKAYDWCQKAAVQGENDALKKLQRYRKAMLKDNQNKKK